MILDKQRRELAPGQRRGERQHRLAAGRLVAVLLADQPDHRPAERADRRRIGEAFGREIDHRDVAALGRPAEARHLRLARVVRQRGQELLHRVLAGERRLGRPEGGAVELHAGNCRIVCQYGRPLAMRRRLRACAARQQQEQAEQQREMAHRAIPPRP